MQSEKKLQFFLSVFGQLCDMSLLYARILLCSECMYVIISVYNGRCLKSGLVRIFLVYCTLCNLISLYAFKTFFLNFGITWLTSVAVLM